MISLNIGCAWRDFFGRCVFSLIAAFCCKPARRISMRSGFIAMLLSAVALGGCAAAQGMGHQTMSHEEMMRHCQMMEQHQAQGGHDSAEHDPARHGGMSHDEMMRHCAEMRAQGAQHQH
ncbi:MAG TPA: hypothetical protein PKY87_11325 [Terricaulis sp.]|nr:hypothetical protein [Terricaulis sp.]